MISELDKIAMEEFYEDLKVFDPIFMGFYKKMFCVLIEKILDF